MCACVCVYIYMYIYRYIYTYLCVCLCLGFQGGVSGKEHACQGRRIRVEGSIPGLEDALEEGTTTHSSILAWRIPIDRGAWQAVVHRVSRSQTRLKRLSTHAHAYPGALPNLGIESGSPASQADSLPSEPPGKLVCVCVCVRVCVYTHTSPSPSLSLQGKFFIPLKVLSVPH